METVALPGGRRRRVYLSGADGRELPRRALVVLHELLGLNDDMRRIADRFAEAGYVVAAPDLFEGRGPKPLCILRTLRMIGLGGGEVLEEIDATRRWLAARQDVREDAVGVVGFCMGGGFAVLAAGKGEFAVAAPFYAEVPKDPSSLPRLCPTVASYGGRDRVFRRYGERLETHLERAGVPNDVVTYPEAGHSFMNEHPAWVRRLGPMLPIHARYDHETAEACWARMLAFFDAHLGAD